MTDKRVQRGADRRAAWRAAALAIRRGGAVELHRLSDDGVSDLAAATLEAIEDYCDARARGDLGPPPGGVKWKKKGKGK